LIDPNQTGVLRTGGLIVTNFSTSTTTPGTTATCGPVWGNDVITDGFGNASTSYYLISVSTVSNGIIASTPAVLQAYQFAGSGTFDLSATLPFSLGPVSPAGSVLGQNLTFNGNNIFNGTTALLGGGSLAGTFTGNPTFSGTPNFTGATGTFTGTFISGAAAVAQSGSFRLANSDFIKSRDPSNTIDQNLIGQSSIGETILGCLATCGPVVSEIGTFQGHGNTIYSADTAPTPSNGNSVTVSAPNGSGAGSHTGGNLILTPGSGNNGGLNGVVRISSLFTFATLPACAAGTEGALMPVSDSTTITWGATITGTGANHVLAYCDGTNWTVAAK
jgi:hypothetical protein